MQLGKPFVLPPWRKVQVAKKQRAEDRVIAVAVNRMEEVMRDAVDSIITDINRGDVHPEIPNLAGMFGVTEGFYRGVVTASFNAAQEEKRLQRGKTRLAKGPTGIPRNLKSLQQIFGSSKEWQKILKRSGKLTERLRKAFVQKLRRRFEKIMPMVRNGEITPNEVKKTMMEAWEASKSRVETIFRTETTNYFAKTQVSFFEGDDEIIGFMFDSIRDRARTDICKSRHGLVYRPGTKLLRENTPALHWNCRSHLIALANTPYNRTLLEDPDRDPSKHSVVALPPGWRK